MKNKKLYLLLTACMIALSMQGGMVVDRYKTNQNSNVYKSISKDTTTFKGELYNKEYDVYLQIDFYHNNVTVPNQEIYGNLPGFFGDKRDARKWLFTDAVIDKNNIATITIINDYGSEDLVATLEAKNDTTFIFTQGKGSNIKIARNRKWVKMPKKMEFIKK